MTRRLPFDVRTLGGMVDFAADRYPQATVGTISTGDPLPYGELAVRGRGIARGLLAAGVAPGTAVAVLMSSGVELVQAVSGVAMAGAVVVPLPVPIVAGRAHLARLRHVIEDSGVRFAVVDDSFAEGLTDLLPALRTLPFSSLLGGGGTGDLPAVDPDDLAVVQYSSGSTSDPHGVELTHRNVLAGIRALQHGTGVVGEDLLCHWLPLSHDMGLFSTLAAVGAGISIRTSSPQSFIKHPADWLRRACDLRATILVGPDSYYRYLVDAVPRDRVVEYDLSAVRVMINGAEPIDPVLVTGFAEHFAASGLATQAMTPCYGLAEATLAVTIAPSDSGPTVDWVDRDVLNIDGQARAADPGAAGSRGVVNCGAPVPGVEVRIVEDGRRLPDRVVGDIEIRGTPVMRGYRYESTPSVHPDGWCPTGDLGYLVDSCLHVTGRRKELLIIAGRNHYPQDVEVAVRQVRGVHRERAVATVLPADPPAGRPERICVLAEVATPPAPSDDVVSGIREAAAGELDGAGVDVVLVRRGALLRTTSGKYQRLSMRQQLLAGTLDGVLLHVPVDQPVPQVVGSAP